MKRAVSAFLLIAFAFAMTCTGEDAKATNNLLHIRNAHEWEEMTNSLEKRPADERNLLVLYTMSSWGWCDSCRTMENVTRYVRSISKHKSIAQSKAGTLLVATVDCSAMMHFLADSPCGEVSEFPTITLFTDLNDRKEERINYQGMMDVFGVLRFLSKHLPNIVTKGFLSGTVPESFRIPPEERITPAPVKAMLKRDDEREIRRTLQKADKPTLIVNFLYTVQCRNCHKLLSIAEDAARQFEAAQDVSLTDIDVKFTRSVSDANTRKRWLPQGYDVPLLLAFFTEGNGQVDVPLIWEGPTKSADDFVLFLQRLIEKDFPVPSQQATSSSASSSSGSSSQLEAGTLAASLPQASNEKLVVIRSPRELKAELESGRQENPHAVRLMMLATHWTTPEFLARKEVTDFIQAAHTFHQGVAASSEESKRASFLLVDGTSSASTLRAMLDETPLGQLECASPPCLFVSAPGGEDAATFVPFPHVLSEDAILTFITEKADDASKLVKLPTKLLEVQKKARKSKIVPVRSFRPTLDLGPEDVWEMAAVRGKQFIFTMITHPVTTLQHNNASQVNLNRLARHVYESSCNEIMNLPNQSTSIRDKTDPSEVICTLVDSSRAPELVHYLNQNIKADTQPSLATTPYLTFLALPNFEDIQSLFTKPAHELFYNRDRLADSLVAAANMHPRFASILTELTINNFEQTINDPTIGAMVMFYAKNDEHSENHMASFELAAKAFKKDNRAVIMAKIDVHEQMDDALREQYDVTFWPEFRWFPRNSFKKGKGEVFPSTPFKDALIEFVNEEMGYPSFEFEEMDNTTLTKITKVNWADVMVNHAYKSHTVLFLYESRERENYKMKMLKRVQDLFMDSVEFAQPADDHQRLRNENIFNFFTMDGLRHRKMLKNNGFEQVLKQNSLPLLCFLPKGAHKLTRIQAYRPTQDITDGLWSEFAVARWLLQKVLPDRFGSTDKEGRKAIQQALPFTNEMLEKHEQAQSAYGAVADIEGVLQLRNVSNTLKGADFVVMYYASWCEHCKAAMPIYISVAQHFFGDLGIQFFRCDVPQHEEVGHMQGIQEFPTIRAYFAGSERRDVGGQVYGDTYRGTILQADNGKEFTNWLSSTRGTSKVNELDEDYRIARNNVLELNESNWDEVVENGDTHVLVEFYAPWCGHCHELIRPFNELSSFYKANPVEGHPVTIAAIDGTEQLAIAEKFGVKENFPTIFMLVRNSTGGYRSELFKTHFFFDHLQKFMEEQVMQLRTSRITAGSKKKKTTAKKKKKVAPGADDTTTNKKKKKNTKTTGRESDKKKQAPRFNKNKSKREEVEAKKVAERESRKKKLDKQKPPKPKSHGFNDDVTLMNEKMLKKELNKTTVVVALRYKFPNHRRMNMVYASMATMLKKVTASGRLRVVAVPQHELSDIPEEKLPMVTMYRGLAQPQVVEFQSVGLPNIKRPDGEDQNQEDDGGVTDEPSNDEQGDSEQDFIERIQSVVNPFEKGNGGLVYNITHLGDFVERWFTSAAKFAREANDQNFNIIIHNPNQTTVVFMYSPSSYDCKKVSGHFDAVGQSLSHREDIAFWNLDVTRNSDIYKKFGKRKLPMVLAFDRHDPEQGEAPTTKSTFRHLSHGKALPKRQDVYDFTLNRPMKADSRVDVNTISMDSQEMEDSGDALFHPLSGGSVHDLQYLMEKHDKSLNGMLVLFTQDACPYCADYRAAMMRVVAKLTNYVVVSVVDLDSDRDSAAVKEKFKMVKVFPSIVLFTQQKQVVYQGPKDNVDELVTFVKENVDAVDNGDAATPVNYRKATAADMRQARSSDNTAADLLTRSSTKTTVDDWNDIEVDFASSQGKSVQVSIIEGFWCGSLCKNIRTFAESVKAFASVGLDEVLSVGLVNIPKPGPLMKKVKDLFKVRSLPSILVRCPGVPTPAAHEENIQPTDTAKPIFETVQDVTTRTIRCTPSSPLCKTPRALAKLIHESCFTYYVPPFTVQAFNVTGDVDPTELKKQQDDEDGIKSGHGDENEDEEDEEDDDDLNDDVVVTEEKEKEEKKKEKDLPDYSDEF